MAKNPEVKQFYNDYKSKCVCAECGTNIDISLIHMDISTKKAGIAEYKKEAPNVELFKEELGKCVALCKFHASRFKYDTHRDDFKDHYPASEWHNHIDLGFRTKEALALLIIGYDRAIDEHMPTEDIFNVYFPGNDMVLERIPMEYKSKFYKAMKFTMEELKVMILDRRVQLKKMKEREPITYGVGHPYN